ncbi:MAG: TlpA disulfide reductase family protein [Pseudomonadota bacterium]
MNKQQIKMYTSAIMLMLFMILNTQASEQPPLTHNFTAVIPPISIPNLKLQNMDEEDIDIKTLRGKVIIINFWATWCPPCRREMTSLEKLHLATKDNNVVVLAVNIGEEIETAFSFVNSIEPSPSFPILFDKDSSTMEQWKVRGLPTTYIINTQGLIVYKAIGGREFDHPEIIQKVLNLTAQVTNK